MVWGYKKRILGLKKRKKKKVLKIKQQMYSSTNDIAKSLSGETFLYYLLHLYFYIYCI